MGKYDNNPIIEGRYDAYGRKTYWDKGYTGKGVKVGIIDEFNIEHGHNMASVKEYIAPDCELIKLEMCSNSTYAIELMLYEAIKQGANIVSISRGSYTDVADLHRAVTAARNAGILMFCSAGNDGNAVLNNVDILKFPASYPETISVLCIDNTFVASTFSSHSNTGTITGFGQNVLVKNSDGAEILVTGTSATTATCAFTAALHWQKVKEELGHNPSVDYMTDFVIANTVDMGVVGKDVMTGFGFFTLDKREYERVRIDMLDADKNGMTDRVDRIKELMQSGTSYEEANKQVNKDYYIISYELENGVPVPIYGGRKPW